jgi:SAM-dependent methyltransferase
MAPERDGTRGTVFVPLAPSTEFDEAPRVTDPVSISMREAWERHADDWAIWARTPDHDHFFWHYNLPRFLEILPPPGELTLDLGCGEGRVGRALAERGHQVVALDASPTLVSLAASHEQPLAAVLADASSLPLPNAVADRAIAFMSLQDVDDLVGAVHELGRVVRPGGIVCIAILHPITTAGEHVDDEIESAFVLHHPYAQPRRFVDAVERDGFTMEFHSIHRPLSTYTDALHDAGFVIELLREPVPDAASIARFPRLGRQLRFPWYLHVRARRDGQPSAADVEKPG